MRGILSPAQLAGVTELYGDLLLAQHAPLVPGRPEPEGTDSGMPELDQADHQRSDRQRSAKGPDHEAVHALLQRAHILTSRLKALVHVYLYDLEALINLLAALFHLREALAHQIALMAQLLFDAHHALAQLDLIDGRWLIETLLREPLAEMLFDEPNVFLC
ncbi:hypothetical protein [Thiohalocapsa halophila]